MVSAAYPKKGLFPLLQLTWMLWGCPPCSDSGIQHPFLWSFCHPLGFPWGPPLELGSQLTGE